MMGRVNRAVLPLRLAVFFAVLACFILASFWIPNVNTLFIKFNDSNEITTSPNYGHGVTHEEKLDSMTASTLYPQVPGGNNAVLSTLNNFNGQHEDGFYQINDANIYIFSAVLDARYSPYYLRMLGMQTKQFKSPLLCLFTLKNDTVIHSSSNTNFAIFPIWPSPKVQYLAHQYSCELPDKRILPQVTKLEVYIKGSKLRTMIPFNIVGRAPDEARGALAVCVKAAWGSLDPKRLVEWIETNRALGVEKIIIYDRGVVGPAARALEYYKRQDFVEVIPFTYILKMATLMADDPMRFKLIREDYLLEQGYLVSINDCYYRLRDRYKYVLLIDVDEVLVPAKNETILSLIARSKKDEPFATCFTYPTAWHFGEFGESSTRKDIPKYMYMQRHLKRTHILKSAHDQPKSIFDTDGAVTLNWHVSIRVPTRNVLQESIRFNGREYGFIHHFRQECETKYENDVCVWMKEDIVKDDVLQRLGYISGYVARVLKLLQII